MDDQIHLRRPVDDGLLTTRLSELLAVPTAAVDVRSETVGGEFTARIDLRIEGDAIDRADLCSRLAGVLGQDVLGDDGTANPYHWVLYRRDGTRQVVSVDIEALGERDELSLLHPVEPGEIASLWEYYGDATASFPANDEQQAAFDALSTALRPSVDPTRVAAALAQVRAVWPEPEVGTTLWVLITLGQRSVSIG